VKKTQTGKALVVDCFSVRFPARISGADLPVRKLVLPWGVSQSITGPVRLDESSVQVFAATQKSRGWDRVALDYEHATVPGTPENKRTTEPRDVAAFGVPVLVPGEGLYLDSLEWTPGGVKAAANFCDLSPALAFLPGTRTVAGLHSVALTRAGAIEGIRAFSVDLPALTNPTGGTMERTVLLALLGLADSATEDEILQAAKTLGVALKQVQDLAAMSAEVKTLKTSIETFSATGNSHKVGIEGLAGRLQKVEEFVVAFNADRARHDRAAVIDQAKREGKVLPFSSEALATVPLDTLREVAKNTPATVPMEQRTTAVETFSAARTEGTEPAVADKVSRMFGRTQEDLRKAGV